MLNTEEYLDVNNSTLEEWLELVFNPPKGKIFKRNFFPTDNHRNEYIEKIDSYSEEKVLHLVEVFLVKTGSMEFFDQIKFESLREFK